MSWKRGCLNAYYITSRKKELLPLPLSTYCINIWKISDQLNCKKTLIFNLLSKCIFNEVILDDTRPACVNQVNDNAAVTQLLIVETREPTWFSSAFQLYTFYILHASRTCAFTALASKCLVDRKVETYTGCIAPGESLRVYTLCLH